MVKIKLKTLANKTYDMELEADLSVADLKQQINDQFGLGEPELLKLIYTGKVLKDDQTITQAGIKEGGFIVVMATKKKEQPAPATPPAPAEAPSPAPVQAAAPSPAAAAPAAEAAPSEAGLLRGPAYDQAVENLMALGFDRLQVARAMQASFNNPDRAAEYLLSGMPDDLSAAEQAHGPASDVAANGGVQQVDIHQLQQMFQDRPEMLEALINQIGVLHPQLLPTLGDNRAAFAQILQDPVVLAQVLQAVGSAGPIPLRPEDVSGADMNAENVIHVSPADRQAIERLESLGFSRDRVLEAYLACDRNEEVAANYLFESGNDPESDD